jgi:hypothetical protein
LLGVNFASAASTMTRNGFETAPGSIAPAGDTFRVGMKLVGFMKQHGLEQTLPTFWYDDSGHPELDSIQSLYFFEYTALNRRMPVIDDEFRSQVKKRTPNHVVLLCTEPTCDHASTAMRQAGFHPREVASTHFASGAISVWVDAYAVSPDPR